MWRFLIGVGIGMLGAYYLQARPRREELESRMRDWQTRTNAVLDESRRILDETRGEVAQALEAGRESVQHKAERLKSAATLGRPGEMGAPNP